MAIRDSKRIDTFLSLMNNMGLPHKICGDRIIINERYYIAINRSFEPWRCTLYRDGKNFYSSNPTGILLMANYLLKKEKKADADN